MLKNSIKTIVPWVEWVVGLFIKVVSEVLGAILWVDESIKNNRPNLHLYLAYCWAIGGSAGIEVSYLQGGSLLDAHLMGEIQGQAIEYTTFIFVDIGDILEECRRCGCPVARSALF